MAADFTHYCLLIRALADVTFRAGPVAPIRRGQPLNHRPASAPFLVTALYCPVVKLLADTIDHTTSAAVAHGFVRRSKGTSGLPPLALPAALSASAYLPSLERGWHSRVTDTSAVVCHFLIIYKGMLA